MQLAMFIPWMLYKLFCSIYTVGYTPSFLGMVRWLDSILRPIPNVAGNRNDIFV